MRTPEDPCRDPSSEARDDHASGPRATPETDYAAWGETDVVEAAFARRLERQRDGLMEALERLLLRDMMNTCQHEETHRGGAIWEICDQCDAKWADDRGGKPKWQEPVEWTLAESAIAAVKGCRP